MTLTLRAVSLNDQPLTQSITAHFDHHGGTIGRADHNTMALPDPVRHISRQQADVIKDGSDYVIKNVGANPIMVRNQALAQGESAPLMHSDQVRIGGYLLEVIDESAGDTNATTVTRGRAAAEPLNDARALAASPLGDRSTPLSRGNPFANLLSEGPAPAFRPAPDVASSGVGAPVPRLPEDFDPFAMPVPQPASRPSAPRVGGAFDDLIPSAAPASIDEIFGLESGSGRDSLAEFMSGTASVRSEGHEAEPLSTDPLALFGHASHRSAALPPETSPDHAPELLSAFVPPKPVTVQREPSLDPTPVAKAAAATLIPTAAGEPQPMAATTPEVQASPCPSTWDGNPATLWSAFCEGAGIKLNPPQGPNPELMRIAGALLRTAIEGTLQLMAVRSATRHELHAQVTVIRPRNNNPLKFSPDAQSALEQLLQPPLRGFLPGPAAMTDAMNDLVGHAIGTMAGTRAALEGVLGRFAPQELEAKLVGKSVLDSVLPMNRKAKLWELYLQHYEAIRDEAQEDFQALFGKAFLAAYEQQLERLRRDKTARAAEVSPS